MDFAQTLKLLLGFGTPKMDELSMSSFLLLLMVSLTCSFFISGLYLHFYKNRATGSQIHRCFPLLGISVTGLFICIQFSLPLSLGLLGALSIVRFRTPIKEPEEIGFIMLVITSSIACATFNLWFLALLMGLAVVALLIQTHGPKLLKDATSDGLLTLTLPEQEFATKSEKLLELLRTNFPKGQLESLSKNGDQSTLSYSFTRLNPQHLSDLQKKLKELSQILQYNLYFSKDPL